MINNFKNKDMKKELNKKVIIKVNDQRLHGVLIGFATKKETIYGIVQNCTGKLYECELSAIKVKDEDKQNKIPHSMKNLDQSHRLDMLHLHEIMDAVSDAVLIKPEKILSDSSKREICDARHIFIGLCVKYTTITYSELGRFINRHHSTAINSMHQHFALYKSDFDYQEKYNKADAKLLIIHNIRKDNGR